MKPIHVRLGAPVAPALTFLYVARSPAKFLRNWHSVLRLEGKRGRARARIVHAKQCTRVLLLCCCATRRGAHARQPAIQTISILAINWPRTERGIHFRYA